VHEAACPAHARAIPFLTTLELLRGWFGIQDADEPEKARRRVDDHLARLEGDFGFVLPVILDFLRVPHPARPSPQLDADQRHHQLAVFVRELVRAEGQREPLVVCLDDIHWIDAPSDRLLAHLVAAAQGGPVLLLLNFRPEYHAAWMSGTGYQQLALAPLVAGESETLLRSRSSKTSPRSTQVLEPRLLVPADAGPNMNR
jgi:predicted ATPase